MSLVSSIFSRRANGRSQHRTGRLGIDIGSHALRVVQVERMGRTWKICNRFAVPVSEPVREMSSDLASGLLQRYLGCLRELPLARTRHCHCVLPMDATELRTVTVPPGSPADIEMMSKEALRDSFESDLSDRTLRCWTHRVAPRDMVQVSGVSVRTDLAESLVDQFQTCGWKCHQFNSLPHALSRAWQVSGGDSQTPVGLLSLRHSSAMLTVTWQDQPEFVRSFRGSEGRTLIDSVADGLGLAAEDAVRLLESMGIAGSESDRTRRAVAQKIEQLMEDYLQQLGDQLQKTLMYLRHHLPRLFPEQIQLTGELATVPGLERYVERLCGVPTRYWSSNAVNARTSDPQFAAAIAAASGGFQ